MTASILAATLIEQQPQLAEAIVARLYRQDRFLMARYGDAGRAKCLQDTHYHLQYLTQALRSESPQLFSEYIKWVSHLLHAIDFPLEQLVNCLQAMDTVLQQHLTEQHGIIRESYLQPAMAEITLEPQALESFMADDQPLADLARRYLLALLAGNRQHASQMISAAVASDTPVRDLYLQVFQTSQWELGRLWQLGQISVGQEHFCTAATQMIMSQLYPYVFSMGERIGKRMVAVCVGGEVHEIGLRMVSDFFEMAGWDTYYLGANVPLASVLQAIDEPPADLLAISSTITTHLYATQQLIDAVRAQKAGAAIKILVGGYAFNIDPQLWRRMGADGCATDAELAVALAGQLTDVQE